MAMIVEIVSNSVITEWTPQGQADQTPKSLGLRIIKSLRETFAVNEDGGFYWSWSVWG